MIKNVFVYAVLGCCAFLPLSAKPPQSPVPTTYQDLYNSLNSYISSFANTINIPRGPKYPVAFSAQVVSASANAGPQMLNSNYYQGVLMELDGLKALGIQAAFVSVGFPILYQPYYTDPSVYQQYVNFYGRFAQDVRARGLKLIVQSTYVLSQGVMAGGSPRAFYSTLTWNQYQAGRAQNALAVLQVMHPDYLIVVEEPDTETFNTGQTAANTVSGSTGMLNAILAAIQQSGITGSQIGAGVGTWHPQFLQFAQSFAATAVDFLDMHIFEANGNYLPNATTIANTAAAAGKGVAISQAWLGKIRDSELTTLSGDQMIARDPFSFWSPLDTYFLQTLVKFSYASRAAFLAPFFCQYFRANLPYNSSTQSLTPAQITSLENSQWMQNLQQAQYADAGLNYYSAILAPPDRLPPSTPASPQATANSASTAWVTWTASTDNIGVAGYRVYRNGVLRGTTALPYYQDTGLSGSTTYSYYVQAFDAAMNLSSPTAIVQTTTLDGIPPTAPTNVSAVAVSSTQVALAWSPSQDNTSIAAYYVFRGLSPTTLAQSATVAGSQTSSQDFTVTTGTTYYYAVRAIDSGGNLSPMSTTVAVTTP